MVSPRSSVFTSVNVFSKKRSRNNAESICAFRSMIFVSSEVQFCVKKSTNLKVYITGMLDLCTRVQESLAMISDKTNSTRMNANALDRKSDKCFKIFPNQDERNSHRLCVHKWLDFPALVSCRHRLLSSYDRDWQSYEQESKPQHGYLYMR